MRDRKLLLSVSLLLSLFSLLLLSFFFSSSSYCFHGFIWAAWMENHNFIVESIVSVLITVFLCVLVCIAIVLIGPILTWIEGEGLDELSSDF